MSPNTTEVMWRPGMRVGSKETAACLRYAAWGILATAGAGAAAAYFKRRRLLEAGLIRELAPWWRRVNGLRMYARFSGRGSVRAALPGAAPFEGVCAGGRPAAGRVRGDAAESH